MRKFQADAQVTQRLKFKPIKEKYDGLCLGTLLSVTYKESDAEKNTSKGEYGGLAIPYLEFEFIQHKEDKGDADRFYNHLERVINSSTTEGIVLEQKVSDSLYESLWFRIKHMYDALGGKPLTQKQLDKVAIDEEAEPADRIEQFKAFFQFAADLFNKGKDDKPIFAGKLLVLKLPAEFKDRKYYKFPTFVGQGFMEIARFKNNKLDTVLELKPSETIELSKGVKPQAIPDQEGGMDSLDPEIQKLIAENQG